jgi:hypothetical protein
LKVVIIAKLIPAEREVETAVEINIWISARAIRVMAVIEADDMPADIKEWTVAV